MVDAHWMREWEVGDSIIDNRLNSQIELKLFNFLEFTHDVCRTVEFCDNNIWQGCSPQSEYLRNREINNAGPEFLKNTKKILDEETQ